MIYQINNLANLCGNSEDLGVTIFRCVKYGGTVIHGACEEISIATVMADIAESNPTELIKAVCSFTGGDGSPLLSILINNAKKQSAKIAKEYVWIAS